MTDPQDYARLIRLVLRRLPNGQYEASQYAPDLTVVGKTAQHSRPSMALAALMHDNAKNIDIVVNEDYQAWISQRSASETELTSSPDKSKPD